MITNALPQEYYQALVNTTKTYNNAFLTMAKIDTPLGHMIAIADDTCLYLLDFVNRRDLERKITRIQARAKSGIIPGNTHPIQSIEYELTQYFAGILKEFKTPLLMLGSDFQKSAWHILTTIPYGQTTSYTAQAKAIGNPYACRAVGSANGANQFAIVIPCHRIITNNGKLGGYGGGVTRKQWLIEHERKNKP